MAHKATEQDVGAIVQVHPPFSGHRAGVLKAIGPHASQAGIEQATIDFGEGRDETLMDWNIMVLDEGEEYDVIFAKPIAASGAGMKKPSKSKAAPKPPAAEGEEGEEKPRRAPKQPALKASEAVVDEDGNPPPGFKFSVMGSGKLTRSNFFPGEDATAKSLLLRVQRGEKPFSAVPPTLLAYLKSDEKWLRWFPEVAEMTDDSHYEATQEAKRKAAEPAATSEAQAEQA